MANEISVTQTIAARKGSVSLNRSITKILDWATARTSGGVQTIGTTHEAITIGADIAANDWAYFVNLDSTNYVEIGRDVTGTFTPLVRLNAGEGAMFRLAQDKPGPWWPESRAACLDACALLLEQRRRSR